MIRKLLAALLALTIAAPAHAGGIIDTGSAAVSVTRLQGAGSAPMRVLTGTQVDVPGASTTFETILATVQGYDGLRVITGGGYSTAQTNAALSTICSVAAVPDTSEATLAAASWTQALFGGAGNGSILVGTSTSPHTFLFSDPINVSSVTPTSGLYPLTAIRCYVGGANQTLMGHPTRTFDAWATRPDGYIWKQRRALGAAAQNYATANQTLLGGYRASGGAGISNGGAGFAVNDTITFTSGVTGDIPVIIQVSAVTGGSVTGFNVTQAGYYQSNAATRAQSATSGTGTGFVLAPVYTAVSGVTQYSPIMGIQYLSRGKVVATVTTSDSQGDGSGGTYQGAGFSVPAALSVGSATGVPVETANLSWAGTPTRLMGFTARDFITAAYTQGWGAPDILVMPVFSSNDAPSTPITQAIINNARADAAGYALATARKYGVRPILYTIPPTNYSVRAWGASDSFRLSTNAEVLGWKARGYNVADFAPAAVGGTDGNGQQYLSAGCDSGDHIHVPDACLATFGGLLAAQYRDVIGSRP